MHHQTVVQASKINSYVMQTHAPFIATREISDKP